MMCCLHFYIAFLLQCIYDLNFIGRFMLWHVRSLCTYLQKDVCFVSITISKRVSVSQKYRHNKLVKDHLTSYYCVYICGLFFLLFTYTFKSTFTSTFTSTFKSTFTATFTATSKSTFTATFTSTSKSTFTATFTATFTSSSMFNHSRYPPSGNYSHFSCTTILFN